MWADIASVSVHDHQLILRSLTPVSGPERQALFTGTISSSLFSALVQYSLLVTKEHACGHYNVLHVVGRYI